MYFCHFVDLIGCQTNLGPRAYYTILSNIRMKTIFKKINMENKKKKTWKQLDPTG